VGNNSNRIQQPNVRINPNLVKIKMESDYNPIKKEMKEEPLDENETEMNEDHNPLIVPLEADGTEMSREHQLQSNLLQMVSIIKKIHVKSWKFFNKA